jgi:hypothetical protein
VNAQADGEMIALQSGSGVSLYRSRVRTAARPGQPDSQALTFAAEWTQGAPLIFQVRPILD